MKEPCGEAPHFKARQPELSNVATAGMLLCLHDYLLPQCPVRQLGHESEIMQSAITCWTSHDLSTLLHSGLKSFLPTGPRLLGRGILVARHL